MSSVKKENQPPNRRLVKQKNPTILKKLALAFAIVIVAATVYVQYLAPHTLAAKQGIELESTRHLLLDAKQQLQKSTQMDAAKQKQLLDIQKKLEETEKQLQAKRSLPKGNVAYAATVSQVEQPVGDNETIAWNFLIGQGFTRNQTAGILGNIMQEHGFKTSDVPGGLGIAQWMGGRRANLMARANYLHINTQLQFLVDELNGIEGHAKAGILATDNLESSTIAFSSLFERCGDCRNSTRIQYAYSILGRH